jgi:SpoVK/Ycf46/Vps4 family AAA+-type ATPase
MSDFHSSKTFNNVFFPQKKAILEQIDNFINGEEFYRERGIPWNLSILLHGIPGCGKTSFIKALSNKTRRHLLDIDLSNISTTQDFLTAFNTELFVDNFIPIDKRIIVLEDIDCMESKFLQVRSDTTEEGAAEESKKDDRMNLSCFLNTLDGIHEHHGRILIATTNRMDVLDPAVLRRFNLKVMFKHLTLETAKEIVDNYYDADISVPAIPDSLTGSRLTQLCMMYQNEPEQMIEALKCF